MKRKVDFLNFFNEKCIDSKDIEIEFSNNFLKGVKKHIKTKNDVILLCKAINKLSIDKDLKEQKYKTHFLKGNYKGIREAHLKNDLLLIWKFEKNNLRIIDLGTHSELFK